MILASFSLFSLPDNCFYNSHYNFFAAPQIHGLSIYAYIYTALVLTVCFYVLISRLMGRPIDLRRSFLAMCWAACLCVIAVQTSHQAWYLNTAQRNIGHMTDDQRYNFLFTYSYEIARAFAARVPPGSPGLLISDLKMGSNIDSDVLPYFMFPRLDIVHRDRIPRYLVFYLKDQMVAPVAGTFRPVVVDVKNPTALWERVDDGR